MFQFPGFPSVCYVFTYRFMILHHVCSHIRISADQCLFAAPRSFSQLVTSFFGSQCQGILHMLFFAWTTSISISILFRISFWIYFRFSTLELLCFHTCSYFRHLNVFDILRLAKIVFFFTLNRKTWFSNLLFFPLLCLSCMSTLILSN